MRLLGLRLKNVGPFEDTFVRFAEGAGGHATTTGTIGEPSAGTDDEGADDGGVCETPAARPLTVLFGGGGIGKTTLLAALAVTRPGYAIPPPPTPGVRPVRAAEGEPSYAVTEWLLGEDDPERPHPLVVASPTAVLPGESNDAAIARRREQALFERRAQSDGGFVFVGFSGARWFSRTPNMLSTPERSVLRYDVRHPVSFDDPTRADLTRETKQVLAYAAIARALGAGHAEHAHLARFDAALREVADVLLAPFGFSYAGTSPLTLEPEARAGSRVVALDALPRPARHLLSFGVLTLRALFAAYPRADEPRELEGVAAIDDVEAQQDPSMLRVLPALLKSALPNVQWILTTSSTQLALACAPGEVIALRRTEERIEVGDDLLQ